MTIASLNCSVLQLTEEKSILELSRMFIDNRRQLIATETSNWGNEWTARLSKQVTATTDEEATDVDSTATWNDEEFQKEYEIQMDLLDSQDQALERERANLTTKLDGITAQLESAEKRLNKNVENELKGFAS